MLQLDGSPENLSNLVDLAESTDDAANQLSRILLDTMRETVPNFNTIIRKRSPWVSNKLAQLLNNTGKTSQTVNQRNTDK